MTTQSARVTQTHAAMDLFAAFARQVTSSPDDPWRDNDTEPTVARQTLWCLTAINDPLVQSVLDEIHAERRRRMSRATRAERGS